MRTRILAVLLAALLISAVIPAGAIAEGDFSEGGAGGPVIIEVGSVGPVAPGETVSVPVSIICDAGYAAHCLRMSIYYNADMLTVKSVSPGEVWNMLPMDSMKMCNIKNPGSVDLAILCPTEGMTGVGCLIYINVLVGENCTEPQELIAQVHEFFYSPSGGVNAEDIEVSSVNGVIELASPAGVPGDANDDGEVNYLDISYMYLFIIGESELPGQGAINADFNGDGIISYLDISDLYMFLISA